MAMTEATDRAFLLFEQAIGTPEGHGDWYTMTQETINGFADLTQDHQFIHIDPEACKTLSPWGVPIAHGFLTLSMLTHLCGSIPQDSDRIQGAVMGVNYGFDKVRFVSPVKVNSAIRASSVISAVEAKGDALQVTRTVTVEIQDEAKPALVADWLTRIVFG